MAPVTVIFMSFFSEVQLMRYQIIQRFYEKSYLLHKCKKKGRRSAVQDNQRHFFFLLMTLCKLVLVRLGQKPADKFSRDTAQVKMLQY